MKIRAFLALWACVVTLGAGCAPVVPQDAPADVVVLTHFGLEQKKAYVAGLKQNLRHFLVCATDLGTRNKPLATGQLARQAQKYIDIYVQPAIADPTLSQDLETRMEIAKVHLLRCYVYARCGEGARAKSGIETFRLRYAGDPTVLSSALERTDFGADSLGQALQQLEQELRRG